MKYPKGYADKPGHSKIALSFPNALFKDIIVRAKKEGLTFNEAVIMLCKVGKLDLDECDLYEEPKGNHYHGQA